MEEKTVNVADLSGIPREFGLFPKVLRAGSRENEPFLAERRIEEFQLSFRLSGGTPEARMEIDGVGHHAGFPHVLVKRPGEFHRVRELVPVSSFYFVCGADEPFVARLPAGMTMFDVELDHRFHARFNAIRELLGRAAEFGVADRIDLLCAELLQETMLTWRRQSTPPTQVETRIRRIASYLQLHFAERPELAELARRFGYSPRSLHRHWLACFGVSPGEYADSLRLAEAKRRLTETDAPVDVIAARLNFRGADTFIRAFRAKTGMTPLRYRGNSRREVKAEYDRQI